MSDIELTKAEIKTMRSPAYIQWKAGFNDKHFKAMDSSVFMAAVLFGMGAVMMAMNALLIGSSIILASFGLMLGAAIAPFLNNRYKQDRLDIWGIRKEV